VVQDILNREDALYIPLEHATPDQQLVSSLLPMWRQERSRLGSASIPPPPASPRRCPQVLCPAVEAVREEFRVRGFRVVVFVVVFHGQCFVACRGL
jgi:hypothetical protein